MTKELEFAKELIDFIYESPTAFHAVENVKNTLEQNGFKQLKEEEKWKLEKGKKYLKSLKEKININNTTQFIRRN